MQEYITSKSGIYFFLSICLIASACTDEHASSDAEKHTQLVQVADSERVIREKTHINEKLHRTVTMKDVSFGNWIAKCQLNIYSKPKQKKQAFCSVSPWKGRMFNDMAQPLNDRVTVQTSNNKPPQLRIFLGNRKKDTLYKLECGHAKFETKDNRAKFFYKTDATKFINQLQRMGCKLAIESTKTGKHETLEFTEIGFSNAFKFAKAFVR